MRRALVLVIALLVPVLACSRELLDHDLFAQPDLSGSVRIPLSTTRADGTTYLLRDATVEISGSAMLTLSTPSAARLGETRHAAHTQARGRPDTAPMRDALTTPLPAGQYTLYLRPGFQLVEVDQNGVERAVDASLATNNPLHFSVREFEDATLKLSFAEVGVPDTGKIVFGAPQAVRVTGVF